MRHTDATTRGITRRRLLELALAGSAIPMLEPVLRVREQGRAWAQAPKARGTLTIDWASSPRRALLQRPSCRRQRIVINSASDKVPL